MLNPSPELMAELLEEEISQLLFIADRHRRWGMKSKALELVRLHRQIADRLKDVMDLTQEAIDLLDEGKF